jgi:predicted membrane-bound dolichyl-phosphate-mannose-protein mannosyltransferase
VVVEDTYIKKLEDFSKQFGITPVFATIIYIAGNKTIHLFMVADFQDSQYFTKSEKWL